MDVIVDAAEKGQRYARIFRKAGTFLGQGNITRAVEVLKEGQMLAEQLGDSAMARRFATEIVNAGKPRTAN
jgi:hypothetical protein